MKEQTTTFLFLKKVKIWTFHNFQQALYLRGHTEWDLTRHINGSFMPHHYYLLCTVCLSHKKFKYIMFIGKLPPNCRNIPMILTSMSDKQTGEMKIFTWPGENKEYSIEPLAQEQGVALLLYKSLGIIPMPNREQKFKNPCFQIK